MEFYDVIKTRRSIRSYKDTPIPRDAMSRILEATRVSPSGHNRQFWKFYIIEDPARASGITSLSAGAATWVT